MRNLSCLSLTVLLLALTGCGVPSFLITPVQNANCFEEVDAEPGHSSSGGKVAIIEVEGMLIDVRTGGLLQQGENPLSVFTQQLDQAEQDSSVKAVVLARQFAWRHSHDVGRDVRNAHALPPENA